MMMAAAPGPGRGSGCACRRRRGPANTVNVTATASGACEGKKPPARREPAVYLSQGQQHEAQGTHRPWAENIEMPTQ